MNRLLTWAEAAAVLQISESWLRKQVAAKQIPHTRIGRMVRFTDENLEAIAKSGHVEASPSAAARLLKKKAGVA